jgi:hypothetical protein
VIIILAIRALISESASRAADPQEFNMTTRLILKRDDSDIDPRAQEIVDHFAECGYEISLRDANDAWLKYSEMMCAGWMSTDGNPQHTVWNVMSHFEEA